MSIRRQESAWSTTDTATTTNDASATKSAADGQSHFVTAISVHASAALTWRVTANSGATVLWEGYGTDADLSFDHPIPAGEENDVLIETYGGTSATKAVSIAGYTR